jgi:hypothetical protein
MCDIHHYSEEYQHRRLLFKRNGEKINKEITSKEIMACIPKYYRPAFNAKLHWRNNRAPKV